MTFKWAEKLSGTAKFWIGLCIILVIGIGSAALLWFVKIQLFEKNPRFTLEDVSIESRAGFWSGSNPEDRENKSRLLCDRLGLIPGYTNLFSIDLAKLRQSIMDNIPEVEKVSVSRVLPDKLEVEMLERIPRAELSQGRLIDENGVIMDKDYCANLSMELPKLSFVTPPPSLQPGARIDDPTALMVLSFIKMITLDYPSIQLTKVFVSNGKYIQCELIYKNHQDAPFMVFLDANISREKLHNEIPGRLIPALDHGL